MHVSNEEIITFHSNGVTLLFTLVMAEVWRPPVD